MQHPSPPSSRYLAVLLVAGLTAAALSGSQSAPPDPGDSALPEIIERALARAAWAEEQGFGTRFRHAMTQRTRRFNDDGEVTEEETRSYRVEPYRDALFHRLTTRNGEPIDASALIEEERRWEEFRDERDNPRRREEEDEDTEIKFNEELISRYTATLEGVRELRGRPSYVLSFEPRPGRLPVRRRLDHALNKSRGEAWIDQETYEIAQVSFQLMDRVRLWWGILGTISDATGRLDRQPVAEDIWMNTRLDIYFHVRVLFRTTRRDQTRQWSRYEIPG